MFGIKTKILNFIKRKRRFVQEKTIEDFMSYFQADEYGHEANKDKADLGYGWIHYGFIRQMKPQKILCIGSRYGYIPGVLAQACKDNGFGEVDFVDAGFDGDSDDNWTGVGFWNTQKGKNIFYEYGLDRFITLFVMTTKQFRKKYKELSYDYIYIDGDHSFEGVKTDFDLFFPLLQKGGFMVFHDVTIKESKDEGKYGVWKLWKTLSRKNSIVFSSSHSGLGIFQKVH